MTAQQAATNTIANVLCGDIGRSAEISKYNSRAVAPNRPRYNMPSCDWAERMTPEQLKATMVREYAEIEQLVKQLNIKID